MADTDPKARSLADPEQRPQVSFVIPVRNDARRLARCLDSIRASLYPLELIEIVVIDNGSTDDSTDTARQRQARVLSLPGKRLGALRNAGAAAARGEVLAFVDADHEIVPEWVGVAVEALADGSVGAIGAACRPPSRRRGFSDLRSAPHASRAAAAG